MYNKRLKNRAFKTNGPLQKMIDAAVDERMTALKSEHMSDWEKISSETTELDMSKDPRYESGTTTTDTFKRQGQDDPYEGEKVDSETWQNLYDEAMQGGGSDGMREYVRKYNIDGTAKAEYKQETTTDLNPAELEQIKKREVQPFEPIKPSTERDPEYVSAEMPDKSLASFFNLNPDRAGGMSSHAKEFFDQGFSVDNPTFDVLKDDKWMKKARKKYNKAMQGKSGYAVQNMPFERWVMSNYRPGGSGDTLINQARTWQRNNPMHDDGSHYKRPDGEEAIIRSGAGDTRAGRGKYSENWYDKAEVEGGESSAPQMRRPVTKMLKGRTMAFRKNNMNQAPGFKMKRK